MHTVYTFPCCISSPSRVHHSLSLLPPPISSHAKAFPGLAFPPTNPGSPPPSQVAAAAAPAAPRPHVRCGRGDSLSRHHHHHNHHHQQRQHQHDPPQLCHPAPNACWVADVVVVVAHAVGRRGGAWTWIPMLTKNLHIKTLLVDMAAYGCVDQFIPEDSEVQLVGVVVHGGVQSAAQDGSTFVSSKRTRQRRTRALAERGRKA